MTLADLRATHLRRLRQRQRREISAARRSQRARRRAERRAVVKRRISARQAQRRALIEDAQQRRLMRYARLRRQTNAAVRRGACATWAAAWIAWQQGRSLYAWLGESLAAAGGEPARPLRPQGLAWA